MTNPDDKTPSPSSGSAPSWVDEVLGPSSAAPASRPNDLRIPEPERPAAPPPPSWVDEVASDRPAAAPTPPAPSAPSWVDQVASAPASSTPAPGAAPSWVDDAARSAAPSHTPQPAHHQPAPAAPYATAPQDDWVTRATGGARNPSIPQGQPTSYAPSRSDFDSMGDSARQMMQGFSQGTMSSDIAQKKLIAGLLGIFLGGLGVHKFYLGNTTPGMIMLGATLGSWVLGILTAIFGIGFLLFFVPPLIGLLGLVEGIIYLTKSDADFQREYMLGKKPWL